MVKVQKNKKGLFSLIFLCHSILLSLISLNSSIILAEDIETTHLKNKSSEERGKVNNNATLSEEMSTEGLWFGFEGKVTIATMHETSASKAPSIVAVITTEELKISDTVPSWKF